MKFFSIALISIGTLASTSPTSAWTSASSQFNTKSTSSTQLGMGSRNAQKIASRNTWAESRGMTSENETKDTVPFCTIIGGGRIGSLMNSGTNSILLKRGDTISSDKEKEGTPIFIATRNDSLDGIIEDCPKNRLQDLVFLQNGYLDSYLESKGLSDNTQCLLYLSVPALGVDPVDGITSVNPEGLTAATGVHAQSLADLLASLDLKCNVIDSEQYKPAMFEKLM
jgi:hypothetical protein